VIACRFSQNPHFRPSTAASECRGQHVSRFSIRELNCEKARVTRMPDSTPSYVLPQPHPDPSTDGRGAPADTGPLSQGELSGANSESSLHATCVSASAEKQRRGRKTGTSNSLAKISNDRSPTDELWTQLTNNGVVWRTITPRASWFGGSYERIIGLVNYCLTRAFGRTMPKVDEFQSLLARAEWVINSRPLTYVSNTENDFVVARPVDLLIPNLQFEGSSELFDVPYDDDPERITSRRRKPKRQ